MLLIDASNLLYRQLSVSSIYNLVNSKGIRVGLIHGFLQSMNSLAKKWKNTHGMILCWDLGCSTYRLQLYPDYKARSHSHKDPDYINEVDESTLDTEEQTFYYSRRMLHNKVLPLSHAISIQIYGVEADDIIAWICMNVKTSSKKIIVSTDGDFHQLASSDVDIYNPIQDKYYTEDDIIENYKLDKNIWRDQFILSKAIVGDGSDNIPGTPKCGWGTAPKIAKSVFDNSGWSEVEKSHLLAWQNSYNNREQIMNNIDLVDLRMLPTEYSNTIKRNVGLASILDPDQLSEDALHQVLYDLELNKARTFISNIVESNINSKFRKDLLNSTE